MAKQWQIHVISVLKLAPSFPNNSIARFIYDISEIVSNKVEQIVADNEALLCPIKKG